MREVTGSAALGPHHRMFVDKRPRGLGVALHARGILLRGGLQALLLKAAVRIVAVGALDQAFVYLVVERHGELRLDVGVASEAKRRLREFEQMLLVLAGMNARSEERRVGKECRSRWSPY